MKISTIERNEISEEVLDLIKRLVHKIPWPSRRAAMGDVALAILNGKPRLAENVFGWGRNTTTLGINEFQTKILCTNDLSNRRKLKVEEKHPELLADIVEFMEPHSHSEPSLKTTLLYTNITAKAVYQSLIEKGWTEEKLPTLRTISNILNRQGYRLHTVEKTMVQKKRLRLTPSSKTSGG